MDVRCGRCATEYEFDDALVSERGTTVKCTNCGYQFKIYGSSSGPQAPERWIVRTAANRELVYTSLKDLQRGIARGQVGPNDLLARGLGPARALRTIAEFEPLFQRNEQQPRQPRTLIGGIGAKAESSSDRTPPGGIHAASVQELAPPPKPAEAKPLFPSAREGPTATPGIEGGAKAATDARAAERRAAVQEALRQGPKQPQERPPEPAGAQAGPAAPRPIGVKGFAIPTDVVVHDPGDEPLLTPTPSAMLDNLRAFDDELTDARYGFGPHSRRVRSRWIAFTVLLGLAVLLAATVGRDYLKRFAKPPAPAEDPRGLEFVSQGYARLDRGDFEGAKEAFDKATVLSEWNSGARAGLAQLETMRADLVWFKLQLLDPAEKDLVEQARRELDQRVEKARTQIAAAFQVAAEEPVVIRARVDLSRLSGEQTQARDWVGPISSNPSDPKNAYTLAALDMAEPEPEWKTIIERLKGAAGAEHGFARARAALVYALVRAGDLERAGSELEQLSSAGDYPLLTHLKAFVARHAAAAEGEGAAGHVDLGALRERAEPQAADPEEISAGADFRTLLPKADAALKSGDLARAERLYQAVLARRPDNTEALAGLAEIARRRNDPARAAEMYDRVLEKNPHYLPALIGSADQKWAQGDRQGAVVLYRRVVDQAGKRSEYGKRALERIAVATGESGEDSPEPAPVPGDAAAEPPTAATAPEADPTTPEGADAGEASKPHIDTSDLPEFRK